MFHLDKLPKRIVIAGGGYIANEFAGIFHQFGSHVTLVNRTDVILRGYDEQIVDRLLQISLRKGIDFKFNATIERIEKREDGSLHVDDDRLRRHRGRRGAVRGRPPAQHRRASGCEEAGVEIGDKGEIKVDADNRTTVPSIFAVGDVTDRVQLTPVAIREGQAFADTFFGNKPTRVDYSCIPRAVFSHPPLAGVGMTEGEARNKLGTVKTFTSDFRPMKNVLAGRNERSLYKLVLDGETDAGRRHPHDRPRRARNPPGGGDRGEGRAQEGRFRRDRRAPPDDGRRTGADALTERLRACGWR